ncbi:MAG: hypothetical protein ABFS22_01710, partial [Pseudomonadota bacterium]
EYYSANEKKIKAIGTKSHSWHIGDKAFAKDMYSTINGDLDRHVIPSRRRDAEGNLILRG